MKNDRLISLNAALDEVESLVDTMSVCISMDECKGMRNMKQRVLERLKALPSAQPSVSKTEIVGDVISRQGVLRLLNAVPSEEFATKAMLISGVNALPPVRSELEDKIRAIGYTGKEGRINIHGRMFAVRELPQ